MYSACYKLQNDTLFFKTEQKNDDFMLVSREKITKSVILTLFYVA